MRTNISTVLYACFILFLFSCNKQAVKNDIALSENSELKISKVVSIITSKGDRKLGYSLLTPQEKYTRRTAHLEDEKNNPSFRQGQKSLIVENNSAEPFKLVYLRVFVKR